MIIRIRVGDRLDEGLDEIGLGAVAERNGRALIKINLPRPPEPEHPRTDPSLLAAVVEYLARHGAACAVAECADGHLSENLEAIGLADLRREHQATVIDLDLEDADPVEIDGETHHLPRCLRAYPVRIGLPATMKLPGEIFSNNVKLFVGAAPRRFYQQGNEAVPRPRVHAHLDRSVERIHRAIMAYAPFRFFVNGGTALFEGRGPLTLDPLFVGTDALELDRHILEQFSLEEPGYIRRLTKPDRRPLPPESRQRTHPERPAG